MKQTKKRHLHPPHPSLKGVQYVLFPYDPRVRHWDSFFLLVLLYYCFSVPYMIGVSGGYHMYMKPWWFVVNILLNLVFFVDTLMQFFRAYRDKNDCLVYDLRKIAWNYLKSTFLLNLIASFPTAVIVWTTQTPIFSDPTYDGELYETPFVHILGLIDMFKLLRIARLKTLAKSSGVIHSWWERQDVAKTMLIRFVWTMIMISHWLACFWSFLAYCSVGTFSSELANKANWISNWYNGSYVEGGINPIGWENDIDRYGLSLFWAIQSLTSIGYGNIAPVTRVEYYFGNVLMLLSGFFWAFVIGHLVSIVEHINRCHQQYKLRMDEANDMLKSFRPTDKVGADFGVGESGAVAHRIRRYITSQYDKSRHSRVDFSNSISLESAFPALNSLPLELRKLSSLHLVRYYLQMVPYLSSKYLSPEEQSKVAFKCVILEFSKGETFCRHPDYGRGVLCVMKGFCLSTKCGVIQHHYGFKNDDEPIGVNEVLVEDEFFGGEITRHHFISYAQALFIPRSVILEVLDSNVSAWKNCARWKYFWACFFHQHVHNRANMWGDMGF